MTTAADIADIRHTVEDVERKFAGLVGSFDAIRGQVQSMSGQMTKVTSLVQNMLEFNTAQISELRKSIDSSDEHLRSVRAMLHVFTEQNGRVLRELAELRK